MLTSCWRKACVVALAGAVLLTLLQAAPAGATADPAGTVVLDAATTGAPVYGQVLSASASGFVAEFVSRTERSYYAKAGDPSLTGLPPLSYQNYGIVGDQFLSYEYQYDPPSGPEGLIVTRVLLSDGSVSSEPVANGIDVLANTGDGYLEQLANGDVVRHVWGGGDTFIINESTRLRYQRPAGDAAGLVWAVGSAEVHYLEYSAKSDEVVSSGYTYLSNLALSSGAIGWIGGNTIYRRPRAGGAIVSRTLTGGYYLESLVLTNGGEAWASDDFSGHPPVHHVYSAVTDPGTSAVEMTTPGRTINIATDETDVFVLMDGAAATAGVYHFPVGGDTASPLVAYLPQPAAPITLDLTGGRVFYSDDRSTPTSVWRRDVTTGPLAVGGESVEATDLRVDRGTSVPQSFSGMRSALITPPSVAGCSVGQSDTLTIRDGAVTQQQISLPNTCWNWVGLEMSGPRLLVRREGEIASTLRTAGSSTATATTSSSVLWGPYLADRGAGVYRRDLRRPSSASNPLLIDSSCGPPNCGVGSVAVWGSKVAWEEFRPSVATVSGATIRAKDLATGATWSVFLGNVFLYGFTLGDGVLVYAIDDGNRATDLYALDLSEVSPAPVAIASIARNPEVPPPVLDDHLVSWVGPDYRIRIAPIPIPHVDHVPRYLGGLVPGAFSPNGDGKFDAWKPAFDVTKALSAWTLTLRNSSSAVVKTFTGTAPRSGIRGISWNGHNAAGVAVPDGVYSWTLTGDASGGEGSLTGPNGTEPVTGTVVVRRAAPSTILSAPVVSSSSSTALAFPVAWHPSVALPTGYSLTYDVVYRSVLTSSTGARSLGAIHPWLSNTGLKTKSFGAASSPTAPAQGQVWAFAVRARDNVGNVGAYSAFSRTIIPFDDRSGILTYSSGWTSLSSTADFLGTYRRAATAGPTMTTSSRYTSGFSLIGTACSICGRFRVYVDGALVATIDSYASTTRYRRVLFADAFAGATLHRHTLRIVELGTPGRPRVMVDGVALNR